MICCDEHLRLAQEVARKSITLARDTARLLPLRVGVEEKIAVAIPRPEDLTPADTSSYVKPALADAAAALRSADLDQLMRSSGHSPALLAAPAIVRE